VDLTDHLRVIARNWWRILIIAALVGGGVYALSKQRAKVYEGSALLSVTAGRTSDAASVPGQTVFLTQTYAENATTRPVLREAIRRSGLNISIDEAESRVSADPTGDLGFLTVTAEGPTPHDASRLANGDANALIDEVRRQQDRVVDEDLAQVNREIDQVAARLNTLPADSLERDALQTRYAALLQAAVERRTQPRDRVEVVSSARSPTGASSPHPIRDATLAFLVALVVVAELFVARQLLSDRLPRDATPERVGRALGLPVLAAVPSGSPNDSSIVEAFRALRTSLVVVAGGRHPFSIAVVSPTPDAGKSYTALNLAQSLAAQEPGVLLVDADLRRPALHERLGVERAPGLSELLEHRDAAGAMHSVGIPPAYSAGSLRRLLFLPSGHVVRDPAALVAGTAVERIIAAPSSPPSYVIIDTPPAALFADGATIASQTDAAILVVDIRRAKIREARDTISALTRTGVQLTGVVLNRTAARAEGRYYRSKT
jgi:capsular exopolysaccharide synthesis family protein